MPRNATDVFCTLHKNGTATFLARVVDNSGAPATRAAIAGVAYSIYLLDDQDPDDWTPVAGQQQVALDPVDVVFPSLQRDMLWGRDSLGYNFRHQPDVTVNPAFATAGRRYLVQYTLTPVLGQPIQVRFRVNVI
jgi:hypothetical protein